MKNSIFTFLTALAFLPVALAQSNRFGSHNQAKSPDRYKILFTENKGQVTDQNRLDRPDVLFGGQHKGMTFHLRHTGISYQLNRPGKRTEINKSAGKKGNKWQPIKNTTQGTIYRVDIQWLNSNTDAEILKENPSAELAYFCNNQRSLEVKSFGAVTYKEVYEGIDLKWYDKNGELNYDYICAAGADHKQIKLKFEGAGKLSVNAHGELIVETPLGTIADKAPVVIQNGKTWPCRWRLENNVASILIEGLDKNMPYVIDPVVRVWGTYYGGNALDEGNATTTDASGNVYMAGNTNLATSTVIATSGAFQTTYGGGFYDAFLVKFNSSGARQWSTYYGGSDDDFGRSCAVDASGNVYLAGITSSTAGIATSGAHQTLQGGGNLPDAFLVKFNSSGARQWATYYGGNSYEESYNCSVDAAGNVYLCGTTELATSTIIATSGSQQSSYGGGIYDSFLAKFNSSGVRQWSTYYGGTDSDIAYYSSTDASNNVYLVGTTASTNAAMVTPGCHQSGNAGWIDGYVAKFNSSGVRQWGTYYGGPDFETAQSCAVDASGNVFVSGVSNSTVTGSIATAASHQSVNVNGIDDAFLVKFNSSGARQWGTYYGGEGADQSTGCALDASGNVYIGGTTSSTLTGAISTSGSYQTSLGATFANNAFMAKFNSSGLRQWGTYYGGVGEQGQGCTVDVNGNIYLAGIASTSTGIAVASSGAYQSSFGGGSTTDAFLAKFVDCTPPANPTNVTAPANQTLCSGGTTTISATSGTNAINWYASATGTTVAGTGTAYVTSNTLAAGNYTYYAEASGCSPSATRIPVTFSVSASPTVSASSGTICAGQSFTITPTGAAGYSLFPANGSFTVTPTTNTTYLVYGANANGCLSQALTTVAIVVNTSPTVTVNSGTICSGQSFTIVPAGATSYTIQGGSATVSPPGSTNYTVTGSNAGGCLSQNTATCSVTVNATPTISVNSGTICSGQVFTISPSGAGTYTVQGGSFTVNPASNTNYTVTGTSSNGCLAQNTATANVSVGSSPTIAVSNATICSGQSYTISPSGASSFTIQGGSAIVTPSISTNYTITGSNGVSCLAVNTVTCKITVRLSPTISVNSGTLCSGQPYIISPSGASTYTVQGGSFTVSPTSSTSYTIKGTNSNGCVSQNVAVASITVYNSPTISVGNGTICQGQNFVISPGGADSYSLFPGGNGFTVSPTTNTSYVIYGVSNEGCTSVNLATVNIVVNPAPSITVNSGSICAGQSFTINPSGASNYTIQGGSAVVSPTVTSTYTVISPAVNGCNGYATSSVMISVPPVISAPDGRVCEGSAYTITPTGGLTSFTIIPKYNNPYFTAEAPSFTVSPASSGESYTITGKNALGCASNSILIHVSVSPSPYHNLQPSYTWTLGLAPHFIADFDKRSSLTLTPSDRGVTCDDPYYGFQNLNALKETTTFTVVSSIGQCAITETTTLIVIDNYQVPNFFTPNGDGKNDTWGLDNLYDVYSILVTDNQGNTMFEYGGTVNFIGSGHNSYGGHDYWDGNAYLYNGTLKFAPAFEGTYYYSIKKGSKIYKGTITLTR